MEQELQALYQRAIPEEMPAEVFTELAMHIVKKHTDAMRREHDRLVNLLGKQQALLTPITA